MRDFIVIFLCIAFMLIGFFQCNITLHNSQTLHLNQRNQKVDTIYIHMDKQDIVIIDTLHIK